METFPTRRSNSWERLSKQNKKNQNNTYWNGTCKKNKAGTNFGRIFEHCLKNPRLASSNKQTNKQTNKQMAENNLKNNFKSPNMAELKGKRRNEELSLLHPKNKKKERKKERDIEREREGREGKGREGKGRQCFIVSVTKLKWLELHAGRYGRYNSLQLGAICNDGKRMATASQGSGQKTSNKQRHQ